MAVVIKYVLNLHWPVVTAPLLIVGDGTMGAQFRGRPLGAVRPLNGKLQEAARENAKRFLIIT